MRLASKIPKKGTQENVEAKVPFALTLMKLCRKHGIDSGLIKQMAYKDLCYLVISLETDELEKYLASQGQGKNEEVIVADSKYATMSLLGFIPKGRK